MSRALAALPLLLALAGRAPAGGPTETVSLPSFGRVVLYAPEGAPDQVVFGIDIRRFLRSLEASRGCAYPAGSLEELSRAVQQYRRLPGYRRPMLVGYSSGATLVYAALVAALLAGLMLRAP